MNDIQRILKAAAWRLGLSQFFRILTLAIIVAIGGAMVLRVVQQVVVFEVAWDQVAIWSGVGVLTSALACAWFFRAERKRVALAVDEGANLREAISTALYVEGSQEPWARATVESAAQSARRVELRSAVPIRAPKTWPVVLAMGLAFAVLYLALPKMDWLKREQKLAAEETRKLEEIKIKTQTVEFKKSIDQKLQSLGMEKLDDPLDTNKPGPVDPEAIRRSVTKQLTKLSDQLQQKMQSESAMKMEATRQALQNIKPEGNETKDLAKAMSSGNFSQAKQEIEKLQQKMQSGQMSSAEREAAAEEIKKLAEQINKAAQNKDDLAKKLEQAGMDKDLAKDPEKLKKELEKNQNLSQQQKEQLQQQAEANQQSAESLGQMAEALQKMASECKNGGGSKPGDQGGQKGEKGEQGDKSQQGEKGEGAGQMNEQLSEMEQIAQEMEMAQTALSECNSQMASMGEGEGQCNKMGEGMSYASNPGDWQAGEIQDGNSGARGGPGQGQGRGMGEAQADFNLNRRKDNKNQTNKGPIVASRLVEGDAVLNDSTAEFEAAVSVAEGEVSEEITGNVIPRDRHEAVKNYFGRLKKKADDGARKKAPAGSTAPAKPAEDAK